MVVEESPSTGPELPSFSNDDIISRLIARHKISPHKGAILLVVFNLLLNCFLAFIFNAWFPAVRVNGKVTGGLLTEVGAWTIDLIAQPIIFGTYIWLQYVGYKIFRQLIKDRRLSLTNEVQEALQTGSALMQNSWIKRSGFFLGCIFYSLGTYLALGIGGETNLTWMNAHPSIFLSRMIVGIPFYYMLVMIVFDLVIILITLNRIMKLGGVISIEPSHSDNAGGLGVIGGFVANLGYLGFAFMVVIGGLWWQSWLTQSGGNESWLITGFIVSIAYLLIVPILFFVPLFSTHKAMQAFQQERIQKLSDQIERVSQDLFDNCGNIKKVGQDVDQLKVLEEAILIVSRYRTWPFKPPDLRKYYTLVASPVGAILLGVTGNWFYERIF